MKRYLIAFSLIVVMTLTLIVGFRLSEDAIAVIIGIGLGVLATLPTTLVLIYFVMHRGTGQSQHQADQPYGLPNHHQPPVIIVNGGQQQPGLPSTIQTPYTMSLPSQRSFTVVGEEKID